MDKSCALRKLQEEELDILLTVARLCEKNDITWFLEGGTALGALRHEGFIPWDDDIDIAMLRDDYNRFCMIAGRELPEGYSLHTSCNTPGCASMFAKVYRDNTRFENQETREAGHAQGIFVDVFPYDRLPVSARERKRVIRRASWAQKGSYLYHSRTISVPHSGILGAVERLCCVLAHSTLRALVHDPSVFQDKFDRASLCPGMELSEEVLSLVWPYMEPVPIEKLVPVSTATFEGHSLPVARDLEYYLTNMYGNWRQIPAPEDRHTHLPLLLEFSDGTVWTGEGV